MRYFLIAFISAVFFSSCSSSIELTNTTIGECKEEGKVSHLDDKNTFAGITANNLTIMPSGEEIIAAVNVRSYCNSDLAIEVDRNKEIINIRVWDKNTGTDNCVCLKELNTTIKNVEAGTYTFRVLSKSGNQLLDQQKYMVH